MSAQRFRIRNLNPCFPLLTEAKLLLLLVGVVVLSLSQSASSAIAQSMNGNVSVTSALKLVQNHKVSLIDIRHPLEWRQTGVGQGAYKISMHQSGFLSGVFGSTHWMLWHLAFQHIQ